MPGAEEAGCRGSRVMAMGRVKLAPIVVVALLTQLLGIGLNTLLVFVTHRTHGATQWLATNALTVVFAVIVAVVQAARGNPRPQPSGTGPTGYQRPPPQLGYPGYGAPPRRRGTPVVSALLVVLLVVGVGGYAVTQGARYAVGYISGNESGPDWLARPASATSGQLTLTVDHVYYTRHFTRVEADVQNRGSETISLPVYGYCILTGADGSTLEADAFRSDWSETIPPGVPHHRGTVVFRGKLPGAATSATFSFTQVFGRLGGGALTVRGIQLHDPG
jgi:hypothetical protein